MLQGGKEKNRKIISVVIRTGASLGGVILLSKTRRNLHPEESGIMGLLSCR
jgi:hypothetical protein